MVHSVTMCPMARGSAGRPARVQSIARLPHWPDSRAKRAVAVVVRWLRAWKRDGPVVLHLTLTQQRVPMLSAAALEDRTRPALDGTIAARLRFAAWPSGTVRAWARRTAAARVEAARPPVTGPTQARLGRR